MSNMEQVEAATKTYAAARTELGTRLRRLTDLQERIKRRYLQGIKNALGKFTDAHDTLRATLVGNQALFVKPKTRVFDNVKVGFQKERGKIKVADEAKTIALIKKLFPEQQELLIDTKEKASKSALGSLAANDLKRLGVTVTEDSDQPFIKATDSAIDKLIDALINDDDLEAERP